MRYNLRITIGLSECSYKNPTVEPSKDDLSLVVNIIADNEDNDDHLKDDSNEDGVGPRRGTIIIPRPVPVGSYA